MNRNYTISENNGTTRYHLKNPEGDLATLDERAAEIINKTTIDVRTLRQINDIMNSHEEFFSLFDETYAKNHPTEIKKDKPIY